MSYMINGKYVNPYLLTRPDLGHHTYCHECGAIEGTKLIGDVVVCSKCQTFFNRTNCERLSKKEAMLKMLVGSEE